MRILKHALVAALACSIPQLAFGALANRAAAAPTQCESHVPAAPADFQAIADGRNSTFGVGDITSAIKLPDGRTFFALGDTGYQNVKSDGSAGPLQGFGNNSAWVLSGNCFTLLNRPGPGTRSWLVPPQNDGTVYWPGTSVVVGPRLYVFLTRLFENTTFGTPVGAAVAVFDLPSLQLARITEIPFATNRIFGNGAVYDGGYIYTYASQQETCDLCFAGDMYIARVPENAIQNPGAWRFLAGSTWVSNLHTATPALTAAVSNVNIQRYGNGYLLLTKTLNILGPNVEAWWAPGPTGPWRDMGIAFSVPEPPPSNIAGYTYQSAYTYNPVVLPGVALAGGGFLASYNVNSFDPTDARIDGRMTGPRFVSITLPPPPAAPPRATVTPGPSPWTPTYAVDRAGRVHTVNGGVGLGVSYTSHAVGIARTPTGRGAWVAAADGGVFSVGDARFFGSMGGHRLNQAIVGIGATPTGNGYWLVARDGGVFSFGDARFFGSTGNIRLQKPILSMASTSTGRGYWLAASDGGIFSFGDARFFGSTGGSPPAWPVTAMAPTPDGRGYWLVTLIGQVFSFGDARYAGGIDAPVRAACIGIVAAPGGYRLVDINGNVFLRGATSGRLRIPTSSILIAAG